MALIKPVECNRLGEREGGEEKNDSSTYMWTLARTHAEQSGVFFLSQGCFFPFFFFSSGVACIREHLAGGDVQRESGLFCFSSAACLFVGERMNACIMGQDGTCTPLPFCLIRLFT